MRRCSECTVDVEGDWQRCPLCASPLTGDETPRPLPTIPLEYSRRRVLTVLFLSSLAMIVVSFVAQLLFSRELPIGPLRIVWLGIVSMWLVVLMALRKRRNIAKGTVYLIVLVSLVCAYWDYLTGWHSWSLTYAIPIVCGSAIIALLITVRVMRMEVGDHILYSGLAVLLGLVPLVFVVFGWVSHPLPSAICGGLSILVLVVLQSTRGSDMRHELSKRLNL